MKANGNTICNMAKDQKDSKMVWFIREVFNLAKDMARALLNSPMDPIIEAISKRDNLAAKANSSGMMGVHSWDYGNSINSPEA